MSDRHQITPALELKATGGPVRLFGLDQNFVRIGRDLDSEIVLDDRNVSRSHARVFRRGDRYYVEDLGSKHRTYLDGRPLPPNTPVALRDDGRVAICGYTLTYRREAVSVRPADELPSSILRTLDAPTSLAAGVIPTRAEEMLRAVLEILRALGGPGGLDEALGQTLDALFAVFTQAECGFILAEGADGRLTPRAVRRRDGDPRPPALSRTVLERAMDAGEAQLITDGRAEAALSGAESLHDSGITTALCVPLPGRDGRPLGVLQLDSRSWRARFGPDDLDLLAAAAIPIGLTVEIHRMLKARAETEAAREIQRALLPQHRPVAAGYAFWEHYEPARDVGGDYYDYIPLGPAGSPGRWAIALGDVAGKGMPAALLMARLGAEVRQHVSSVPDPARAVERLNRHLCNSGTAARFITFVLAVIDPTTHRLDVVNAGHINTLVRRHEGGVELVEGSEKGMPLAIDARQAYRPATIVLGPGDVVVLYTDGVSDAMNRRNRQFGNDAVLAALAAAPADVEQVGNAILSSVLDHASGRARYDDMTLICFGRVRG